MINALSVRSLVNGMYDLSSYIMFWTMKKSLHVCYSHQVKISISKDTPVYLEGTPKVILYSYYCFHNVDRLVINEPEVQLREEPEAMVTEEPEAQVTEEPQAQVTEEPEVQEPEVNLPLMPNK